MTLNLLTAVPEGIVLVADSMLTLTTPTPSGNLTTNFEHAEKLIELGANLPAAAMINGSSAVGSELVSVLLKKASAAIDAEKYSHNAEGIEKSVVDFIDSAYKPALAKLKDDAAVQWSQPGKIEQVNEDRKKRNLLPIKALPRERIRVPDDPLSPVSLNDWDVLIPFPLTIIVATYFEEPRAISIEWPGARISVHGDSLRWWGTGGSAVSRVVRGFDMGITGRFATQGDADGLKVLEISNRRMEYHMPIPIAAMPLQDAVNFSEYLGHVACGYDKFTSGPPSVGGHLDVMVLRPHKREWIRQKRIHSSFT